MVDGDMISGVHNNAYAAFCLGCCNSQCFDLHPISIGACGFVARGQNMIKGFVNKGDHKVEPVNARVDDVPVGALDFDEFDFTQFAVLRMSEDVVDVVGYEQAMGHGDR